MKYQHIWEIPDQLGLRGGDLYDTYGNLTYFADTALLTDKTKTGEDKQVNVKMTLTSPACPVGPQIMAAVHGKANAALRAGYGFTGILVSFLARHNPLTIIPVAILFGGIAAGFGE